MAQDWITEWRNASGTVDTDPHQHDPIEDQGQEDTTDGLDSTRPDTADLHLDAATATPAAPPRRRPGRSRPTADPAGGRSRRALYLLAALGGLLLVLVVAVLALAGGHHDDGQQASIAIPSTDVLSTPATPSVASPVSCTESRSDTKLVTDGPGDTQSAPGLIAAFEHAYFTERDPIAAADHLDPAMRVTATAIRGVMDANFPPGNAPVPYCATITPWNDPDTWAVSVDWVDTRSEEVKTWTAVYEVKAVNGQLRITSQRNV